MKTSREGIDYPLHTIGRVACCLCEKRFVASYEFMKVEYMDGLYIVLTGKIWFSCL